MIRVSTPNVRPFAMRASRLLCLAASLTFVGCAAEFENGLEGTDSAEDEEDIELGEHTEAAVQDCSAILLNGVHDEMKRSFNSSDAFALAKGFCKEVKNSGGGGGSLSLFGISLTGSGSTAG
jgi:hypothetical protein